MKVLSSAEGLIGNTPLVRLQNVENATSVKAKLLAKVEYLNLTGSVKDRIALNMIVEAEKSGALKKGGVIIEPTSGNTGIGLAAVAAVRGYRAIIVMPDTMSVERRKLIAAYGAEIVLSDGALGMKGAVAKAEELAKSLKNAFIPMQFANPANPAAHYATTGVEIFEDTDGEADVFVAGVGTGGTLSGTGKYLKEKKPSVKVVAVEPENSAVLSGKPAGKHKIQGIGAGFVPEVFDSSVCDEILTVSNEDAFAAARLLVKKEGLLTGISSGAALSAALKVAARPESEGKTIVVLLPDSGDRYLSTELFDERE